MGLVTTLYKFIYTSIKAFLILLLIASVTNLLPKSAKFTEFHLTSPRPLTGKLSLNTVLNNAERLFEGKIKGPESFAILNGELFTTLHGGYVSKIKNNKIIPVVKFGQDCDYWWEEDKCGRPLGITATDDGHLIVSDAYYGIHKFNPLTGKAVVLVPKDTKIEGETVHIFNAVSVGKDNSVYWSSSSSDFPLYQGLYTALADPSGRLIKYDPKTKTNTVLLKKLHFANGVALSQDEEFVLVAETMRGRIVRVYLKGPKKFQSDVFIDGLPGLPDNIRPNGKGGFLIALNVARDSTNSFLDYISGYSILRKIIAQLLALCDWSMEQINKIYPNYYTKRLGYLIGHFEMVHGFFPSRVSVIELDNNGKVINSFYGSDLTITGVSDIIAHNGYVYLGSPYNNYLGRTKLSVVEGKLIDTATDSKKL